MFAMVTAACGGANSYDDGIGSCTSTNVSQPFCLEYTDASADELRLDAEVMCDDNRGIWALDTCSTDDVAGGCRQQITGPHGSFTLTTWFYGALTEADVMARCATLGGTYVVLAG
jgi:hypothetical protein